MRCTLWLTAAFTLTLLACGYNPRKSSGVDSGAGGLGGHGGTESADAQPGPADHPGENPSSRGEDAAADRASVSPDSGKGGTGGLGGGGSGGTNGTSQAGGTTAGNAGASASASGGTGGLSTSARGGTTDKAGNTGAAGTTATGGTTTTSGTAGTSRTAGAGGLTGTAGTGGTTTAGGTTTGGTSGGGTGGSTVVTECPPDPATLAGTCTANGSRWVNWTIAQKQNFLASSEDLVSDRTTSLVWQRKVAARTSSSCTGPVRFTWDQAMCYCSALSLPGATYGWRLPSRVELMSIVLLGNGSPSIDTAAFPGTTATSYWTSTQLPDGKGAWDIHFGSGGMSTNGDKASMNLVRCVRGSREGSPDHYTLGTGALAGTVLDNATTLRWQVKPIGPKTGEELAQACAASTLGQLTWRLPTLMELVSIVDDTRSDPAFDKTVFEGTSDSFHSSAQADVGWGVNFWWGQTERLSYASKAYGRCVSSN